MPTRVYVYVAATCAVAIAVLGSALSLPTPLDQWTWWDAAVLLVCGILAERGAVEISRDSDQAAHVVSVSTIPHVAAALLLPPWVAMAIAGAGMFLDELR